VFLIKYPFPGGNNRLYTIVHLSEFIDNSERELYTDLYKL